MRFLMACKFVDPGIGSVAAFYIAYKLLSAEDQSKTLEPRYLYVLAYRVVCVDMEGIFAWWLATALPLETILVDPFEETEWLLLFWSILLDDAQLEVYWQLGHGFFDLDLQLLTESINFDVEDREIRTLTTLKCSVILDSRFHWLAALHGVENLHASSFPIPGLKLHTRTFSE